MPLYFIFLSLQIFLKWIIIHKFVKIFSIWVRCFRVLIIYKYFAIVCYKFWLLRLLFSFLRCRVLILSCSRRNHIVSYMTHHSFVLSFPNNKIRLLLLIKYILLSWLLIAQVKVFIISSKWLVLISLGLLFKGLRSYRLLDITFNLFNDRICLRSKYLIDMMSYLFSFSCSWGNLILEILII
jgi:hypothetical protein